jgi:pimeloyl-ACP methyl ester carboxylesterase
VRRTSCLLALLLAVAPPALAAPVPGPVAVRDSARLGIPWTRYTTADRFGRTITFYLADLPGSAGERARPLALVIEGSGCQSVWVRIGGRIGSNLPDLMSRAARGRVRVLVVEKPGVRFLDVARRPGSALGASEEFLREHTLERWTEANLAALRAALAQVPAGDGRVLVAGHSEGATIACAVAAAEPRVTHVAALSGAGPTQLFDLAELLSRAAPGERPARAAARRDSVFAQWRRIEADPLSTTRWWLGHPYRRWATFLPHNSLEDLVRTRARVFLAHGTADRSVPVVSFDWLRAELAARGRDVTVERLEGFDHGLVGPGGPPRDPAVPYGVGRALGDVVEWFLGP